MFSIKLLFYNLFLLFDISLLINENFIFTLYYLLLIILPYLVIMFLNSNNLNKKNFKEDFKILFNKLINIAFYIFLIFFLIALFYPKFYNDFSKDIFIISFHFSLLFNTAILVNYYSTNNINTKKNIIKFINALENVITSNYILNLFCLILLIYLRDFKDLFFAIIGSYIFFVLNEINNNYKEMHPNKSNKYNNVIKILKFGQYFGLLFLFCCFEEVLNSILSNQFNLNIYFLIFAISLNLINISIYKSSKIISIFNKVFK